jgi:hypothetical protein
MVRGIVGPVSNGTLPCSDGVTSIIEKSGLNLEVEVQAELRTDHHELDFL